METGAKNGRVGSLRDPHYEMLKTPKHWLRSGLELKNLDTPVAVAISSFGCYLKRIINAALDFRQYNISKHVEKVAKK